MGQLAQRAQKQEMTEATPTSDFRDFLAQNWKQMAAVLPSHMSGERMFQMAVSAINHTPELLEAPTEELFACLMKSSALGLEPSAVDGLGKAYILPFRNHKHNRMGAQFIIGYKGYIELCRRSGELRSIHAQAVYQGDDFDCWEDEDGQHFKFRPGRDIPHIPENLTDVYVCAHLKDGGMVFERMTKSEVDAIRARSKASQNGPWKTDYEAMALKTVIRRSARYLPMSAQAQEAVAADETTPDYSSIFHPIVSEETQQLPEPQPNDEEKSELRRLADELMSAGCDEGVAGWLWELYRQGGMQAARDGAKQTLESFVNTETGEVQ